ncbi:MAG: dTDP-glucose 4,6-dehydratase [Gemmatimonadetes bacterium]|nr:dTDP-glucose 4,6-dehydratase [Gemmatimonadota bacterium]NNM06692.1 dTDP-glucose 4,6-dehydratase [Gemmatimonadota bacterium]
MRILVTGGAGFIGSNFIRYILDGDRGIQVTNLDALTYAGNLENLQGVADHPGYRFVRGDICDFELVRELVQGMDAVVNLAAESHVDRSLVSATPFVQTNVMGTQNLLAAALEAKVPRFVQVSTDEVYGELPWFDPESPDPDAPRFTEETPLNPRSPYSATKAGADLLALSYHTTHQSDVIVTRCSNNYGPYQFPEKLIPLMVTNALEGRSLPVYGDGLNVRDWIHVSDHCRGLHLALENGSAGRVYNFGGNAERTNLQVVRAIASAVEISDELITFVEDRRGHDRRYAIDHSRAVKELGWEPLVGFEEGLESTVEWYRRHEGWWQRIRSGEYQQFYREMYGDGGRHRPPSP